jgi:hypothetical protein
MPKEEEYPVMQMTVLTDKQKQSSCLLINCQVFLPGSSNVRTPTIMILTLKTGSKTDSGRIFKVVNHGYSINKAPSSPAGSYQKDSSIQTNLAVEELSRFWKYERRGATVAMAGS